MKSILIAGLFFIVIPVMAQKSNAISGYVTDSISGETLPGVTIFLEREPEKAAATNDYGYFVLNLKEGESRICVQSVGYLKKCLIVSENSKVTLKVQLVPIVYEKKAVEITGERADQNLRNTGMGVAKMDIQTIKTLPAFMGEVDIMKSIQLQPGVKSGGDGNSGIYVRGGGPDQNLILLDEAVIYNPAHLLGFFSVFNGDAVSGVELIKGGMPARYGGRLASVMDVSMKEGNMHNLAVDGGIGLISSRLTVQGPLKKDTSSFIFSARRTYADFLAGPFIPEKSQFKGTGLFFYDFNGKVNFIAGSKDRFFFSAYTGKDKFTFEDKEAEFKLDMPWGNTTASARWNHLFSRKIFANTTAVFSNFNFEFGAVQNDFNFRLYSGIQDWNLKSDFNYYPNGRHKIRFGYNYIWHTFIPYNASASQGEVVFDTGQKVKLFAHEAAVYASDEIDFTDHFSLEAGLRYSGFRQVGPFERYKRNELGQRTDTIFYKKGEEIITYMGPEPRIAAKYRINDFTAVKASFTRNLQYLHMVSLSAVSLPTDVWVPSGELVKPQIGNQYAVGFFRNLKDNKWELSVEAYYKDMFNQVEYKEGALPEDNIKENADYNYTFGTGQSYGSEFFLKKNEGLLTGWLGYTLSYTRRTFAGLNSGKTFYAKYDRRHDVSLVMQYKYGAKWIFACVFVYGTGNAITMPESRYIIDGRVINYYSERNGVRMPPYHRMDISATWTLDESKNKKWLGNRKFQSSWNFSIFNLYSRLNPFFIYFENSGSVSDGNLQIKAKKIALFPILPSATYNFRF